MSNVIKKVEVIALQEVRAEIARLKLLVADVEAREERLDQQLCQALRSGAIIEAGAPPLMVHIDTRRNVRWRDEYEKVKGKEEAERILNLTAATEYPHALVGAEIDVKKALKTLIGPPTPRLAAVRAVLQAGATPDIILREVMVYAKKEGWKPTEIQFMLATIRGDILTVQGKTPVQKEAPSIAKETIGHFPKRKGKK